MSTLDCLADQDREAQTSVEAGERALGDVRYEACITHGVSYAEWASRVGVSRQAVQQSVERHVAANGLSTPLTNDRQTAQRSRRQTEREAVVTPASTAADAALDAEPAPDTWNCNLGTLPPTGMGSYGFLTRMRILRSEVYSFRDDLREQRYIERATPDDIEQAADILGRIRHTFEQLEHELYQLANIKEKA